MTIHCRRAALGAASMGILVVLAPALAEPAIAEAETVIVTGYRKSLERAADIKRETVGFSDSVIATDVADFPEQNLSEALQRLPGVTIERNKGIGTRVAVRGLPAEFTYVSINDLATASGSGGRDVEFDIFASELVQQVTVHKSPTAADEEGGIAGSVSIRTARPFDFTGLKLVGSAETAYNSISEAIDPKFSVLASNTWGSWGALVSGSFSSRTNRTDSNSGINFRPMFRFLEASSPRNTQAASVLERDAGVVVNNLRDRNQTGRIIFQDKVGDRVYLNEQDKWGVTAALQYKPSDNFSVSFDALIGAYDTHEDEYDAAAYSASSRSTLQAIHEYDDETLADYGMVVLRDVSYTATQHEFLSKERIANTNYRQFGIDADWQYDAWKIRALIGYSGADATDDYANLKHVAYAPSRTRWTAKGGETVPSADPNTIDMYNAPAKYLFEAYETTYEKITDDKYAAQLDIRRDFNLSFFPMLSSIDVGLRYTDKSKERNYGAENIQGPTRGSTAWLNVRTLADSELEKVTDITGGGSYSVRDLSWSQIPNAYARATFRPAGFVTPFQVENYYKVQEQVMSYFAMANFDFHAGPVPVSINAGARYIDTTVVSAGYHQIQNQNGSTGYTATPVSSEGSYQKLLPSINAQADVWNGLVLRAAASQTLMRPALTDLAYKRTASWNSFRFTDGNPGLKPTYADQAEVGLEKYFDNGGLLAASYFWKRIAGVVRSTLTGTVPNVTKYNANGTVDGVYDFDVYQPMNADGSYDVNGIELVAVVPFSMFHHWFDGFGVNANYTLLDSTMTGQSIINVPTPPVGLAESAFNATLYYENGPFEARASYNYKDRYVESVGYEMYPIYRSAYGQLDIAASYRINDHFQVELKGINMLDAPTKGYTMDPSFPTMYEFSGSRISLGVRAEL